MERKEEIKQAAEEIGLWEVGEAMFIFGAEWADEHPNYPDSRTMFLKSCHFLNEKGLLKDFDWMKRAMEFEEYFDKQ